MTIHARAEQSIQPVRFRSEKQLRDVVNMLAHFVWYRTTRPGDHMWSIPVDQERDWDCILTDAIDELIARRTAAGEVQQPIPRYRVMDDRPCSQCGAPLIWDNVCRGADCLFCLHQAFAACTCGEVQQPIPQPSGDAWEVVPSTEQDDWGIRRVGETEGASIAQMLWKYDAFEIVRLHNNHIASSSSLPSDPTQEKEKNL